MPTFINTNERQVYTNLSLEDTKAAILDGRPLDIWFYTSDGDRTEEHILFTEFNYLSETVSK